MLVHSQSRLNVVGVRVLPTENNPQRAGIFNGLTCPLALVGHHWMSCVAEDAGPSLLPVWVGLVDEEAPRFNVARVGEQGPKPGVEFGEWR